MPYIIRISSWDWGQAAGSQYTMLPLVSLAVMVTWVPSSLCSTHCWWRDSFLNSHRTVHSEAHTEAEETVELKV